MSPERDGVNGQTSGENAILNRSGPRVGCSTSPLAGDPLPRPFYSPRRARVGEADERKTLVNAISGAVWGPESQGESASISWSTGSLAPPHTPSSEACGGMRSRLGPGKTRAPGDAALARPAVGGRRRGGREWRVAPIAMETCVVPCAPRRRNGGRSRPRGPGPRREGGASSSPSMEERQGNGRGRSAGGRRRWRLSPYL